MWIIFRHNPNRILDFHRTNIQKFPSRQVSCTILHSEMWLRDDSKIVHSETRNSPATEVMRFSYFSLNYDKRITIKFYTKNLFYPYFLNDKINVEILCCKKKIAKVSFSDELHLYFCVRA